MRLPQLLLIGAGCALSACAMPAGGQSVSTKSVQAQGEGAEKRTTPWRQIATEQDRQRLRNWYRSWQRALEDGRARGAGAQIDAEGLLLDPAAALDAPSLPAGEYRCRTLKLGAKGRATLGFVAYDWFRCRVEDQSGQKRIEKLSGSQRPAGRLFPDDQNREIFLGTLALGDEMMTIPYGSDRLRDMAGMVERIGEQRWRLVLPEPAYESLLDVIEIIPAS